MFYSNNSSPAIKAKSTESDIYVNVKSFPIRDILRMDADRNVDVVGVILVSEKYFKYCIKTVGDSLEEETQFGIQNISTICLRDQTGIIWLKQIKLQTKFIDEDPQRFQVGNKLIFRGLEICDDDDKTILIGGLWTSITWTNHFQIEYLSL